MESARPDGGSSVDIALVHILNEQKKYGLNKDLNGGLGTADDLGDSFALRVLKRIRRKWVRIPIVEIAFLQAVLQEQGHRVAYFEGSLPDSEFDLVLLYGSLVDYRHENRVCRELKEKLPAAKVGFFGPFPSRFPHLFDSGDFVLAGEPEAFFANQFDRVEQLQGTVAVTSFPDVDALPTPSFEGFPIAKYRYLPAVTKAPFATLQASRGCPYSCRFYCTYGEYQGPKIRQRSARRVVDDIVYLKEKFSIKAIQFRDPIFGLKKSFVRELCDELSRRKVRIHWGMETRLDLLDEENLTGMFDVGLRHINVGIETTDAAVAKASKRPLVEQGHQYRIVKFCEKIGIKVTAFYILALERDTEETIRNTVRYATRLNTHLARFSVSTPYPGTGFYDRLDGQGRISTYDFEQYTQFHLVFEHENLSPTRVRRLLEEAYVRYYCRPSYWAMFLKWRIRGLWL